MRIRRKLTILLVAFGLVAGAAGTGLAAPGDPTPQQAARCARAAQALDRLQAFAGQLAGQIAQTQATLANGGLTQRQTARAQARLTGLQSLQAALNDLIGRLSTTFAAQCSTPTGGGTGGGE